MYINVPELSLDNFLKVLPSLIKYCEIHKLNKYFPVVDYFIVRSNINIFSLNLRDLDFKIPSVVWISQTFQYEKELQESFELQNLVSVALNKSNDHYLVCHQLLGKLNILLQRLDCEKLVGYITFYFELLLQKFEEMHTLERTNILKSILDLNIFYNNFVEPHEKLAKNSNICKLVSVYLTSLINKVESKFLVLEDTKPYIEKLFKLLLQNEHPLNEFSIDLLLPGNLYQHFSKEQLFESQQYILNSIPSYKESEIKYKRVKLLFKMLSPTVDNEKKEFLEKIMSDRFQKIDFLSICQSPSDVISSKTTFKALKYLDNTSQMVRDGFNKHIFNSVLMGLYSKFEENTFEPLDSSIVVSNSHFFQNLQFDQMNDYTKITLPILLKCDTLFRHSFLSYLSKFKELKPSEIVPLFASFKILLEIINNKKNYPTFELEEQEESFIKLTFSSCTKHIKELFEVTENRVYLVEIFDVLFKLNKENNLEYLEKSYNLFSELKVTVERKKMLFMFTQLSDVPTQLHFCKRFLLTNLKGIEFLTSQEKVINLDYLQQAVEKIFNNQVFVEEDIQKKCKNFALQCFNLTYIHLHNLKFLRCSFLVNSQIAAMFLGSKYFNIVIKLHEKLVTHTAFKQIMTSPEKNERIVELRTEIALFLRSIYELDPTLCNKEVLPILYATYEGSMSFLDRNLFALFLIYEQQKMDISLSGYLWGQNARIRLDNKELIEDEDYVQKIFNDSLFDKKMIENSLMYFPENVSLDVEKEPTKYEKHKMANVYDPCFFLAYLNFYIKNFRILFDKIIDFGIVSYALRGLSCSEIRIRKYAYSFLGQYIQIIDYIKFYGKYLILSALTSFKNSITKPLERVPTITSTFMGRALSVLRDPRHNLFESVNKFFSRSIAMDLNDVPMFYSLLYGTNASENNQQRLEWMLEWIENGLSSFRDTKHSKRRHIFELLTSLFDSPLSSDSIKEKILGVFLKAANFISGCNFLISAGIPLWMNTLLLKKECSPFLLKIINIYTKLLQVLPKDNQATNLLLKQSTILPRSFTKLINQENALLYTEFISVLYFLYRRDPKNQYIKFDSDLLISLYNIFEKVQHPTNLFNIIIMNFKPSSTLVSKQELQLFHWCTISILEPNIQTRSNVHLLMQRYLSLFISIYLHSSLEIKSDFVQQPVYFQCLSYFYRIYSLHQQSEKILYLLNSLMTYIFSDIKNNVLPNPFGRSFSVIENISIFNNVLPKIFSYLSIDDIIQRNLFSQFEVWLSETLSIFFREFLSNMNFDGFKSFIKLSIHSKIKKISKTSKKFSKLF